MRRPRDRLDRCQVTAKLACGLVRVMQGPNEKLVVISSGSELLLIIRPLESAYFLLMSLQTREEVILFPEISLENGLVFRA